MSYLCGISPDVTAATTAVNQLTAAPHTHHTHIFSNQGLRVVWLAVGEAEEKEEMESELSKINDWQGCSVLITDTSEISEALSGRLDSASPSSSCPSAWQCVCAVGVA